MSKGPEVEVFLSCVRNRDEARVARAERELGRMVKVRGRGVSFIHLVWLGFA